MAEGARLESVYTATYRGFESPPHRHIYRRARTKVRAFFSHFICLYGSERVRKGFTAPRRFLSCLYGSEPTDGLTEMSGMFLSCLYGSEQTPLGFALFLANF